MQQSQQDILKYCSNNDISLTNQQLLILEMINSAAGPLTANEVLVRLKEINPKANRMTIHRGLESLIQSGLVHKVVFNHTYTLCNHLSDPGCQILVCQRCGKQTELHSHKILQSLREAGDKNQFVIANPIEITGYCRNC